MATISLLSWNVNGIRAAVRNGFEQFLKKTKPDVIGLQEIKIDEAAKAKVLFDFAGYDEYWNPAQRPGYSGTATLIKTNSALKPLKVVSGIGKSIFDTEGRIQTMHFDDFILINVYFPNANHELSRLDYKIAFNKSLLHYAHALDKKKPVIICGDLNVAHKEMDLKNPKSNEGSAGFTQEERTGMDNFISGGFVDSFRHLHPDSIQYSWWSYRFGARDRNIGWRIDYFMVSKRLVPHIKRAYILDAVVGSDHCPVGLDLAI